MKQCLSKFMQFYRPTYMHIYTCMCISRLKRFTPTYYTYVLKSKTNCNIDYKIKPSLSNDYKAIFEYC